MTQTPQPNIQNNGILFVLWGWVMFFNYFANYLLGVVNFIEPVRMVIKYLSAGMGIAVAGYTIFFLFRSDRDNSSTAISLRYIWGALVICLSLVNVILFNVNGYFNATLQHPVFMVLIAFASVASGAVLRYKWLIVGGIIYGLLALACSYLPLNKQLLADALGWLIVFVGPGHWLYTNRTKQNGSLKKNI